ncbi:MAG TPA: hypothetical protein PLI98_16025, partial [Candidatus Hydrogenedentes bacterium]|nr:hypothetical protein [Candidatus Hydrogenedentota bacterium]
MNTRLRATMRVALWGLVLTGLAGSLVARAPGVSSPDPRRAEPVRVAFAGGDAALAGLLSAGLALGQIDCLASPYQVSVELSVSPRPVAPGAEFVLLTRAYSGPDRSPVRIERARYWYVKEDVDAYRAWLADRTKIKPESNANAQNLTPPGTIADIEPVRRSIATGGDYDVIVEAVIVMPDNTEQICLLDLPEAINVAETSAADLTIEEFITDGAALVPLNDWVPLFGFNIKWAGDDPAPRALTRLTYRLKADPVSMADRGYVNNIAPQESDYLIFALIPVYNLDGEGLPAAESVQVGLPDIPGVVSYGSPKCEWDSHGWPYAMPIRGATGGTLGPNGLRYSINDNTYNLSFIYDAADAAFPTTGDSPIDAPRGSVAEGPFHAYSDDPEENDWIVSGPGDGYSYIVAVRLSSAWQTGASLSMEVTNAIMQPYYTDLVSGERRLLPVPFTDSGPVDSYTPNFFDAEILAPPEAYSSSFGVFDVRGALLE